MRQGRIIRDILSLTPGPGHLLSAQASQSRHPGLNPRLRSLEMRHRFPCGSSLQRNIREAFSICSATRGCPSLDNTGSCRLQIQAKLLVDLFDHCSYFLGNRIATSKRPSNKGADREKRFELSKACINSVIPLSFVNLPMSRSPEHHSESSVPCVSLALGTAVFHLEQSALQLHHCCARTDDDSFFSLHKVHLNGLFPQTFADAQHAMRTTACYLFSEIQYSSSCPGRRFES